MSGSHALGPEAEGAPSLFRIEDTWVGRFTAMASPCEVLVDTDDESEAARLLEKARAEALRVERKFSRYRTDNIVHAINHSAGRAVEVDAETAAILDYAGTIYEASNGLFDITSGILRRIWKFDGGDRVPTDEDVRAVLPLIGWDKVSWQAPRFTLPQGMEIDLGGIGKEYAVDRAAALLAPLTARAYLVNFGGDLFASGLRTREQPWSVGIDDPDRTGEAALYRVDISRTGLATSGDARRFVRWKGKRRGHILDPRTGWPVADAPRSVTVAAPSCLEAGTIATLACLQGSGARAFLDEQRVIYWVK
jgi:thiamine biosynthesis lipoprotein